MSTESVVMTLDLLRHGACEGGEIFRGSTDVALSAEGWEQMHAAIADLTGWEAIVSSPMRRCRRFAAQLAERVARPHRVMEDLREIHFGEWEGNTTASVLAEQGDLLRLYWDDPLAVTPPGGEPVADFRARVLPCLDKLLKDYRGQQLLVVSHGAVVRMMICQLLDLPLTSFSRFSVPYAAMTRFQIHEAAERTRPWVQLCWHRG
ncbi:MAG TPA: histidine phosphatase family protein [Spongiibacteraceae bacterium]|nr:histidine phosphatase family protein [Spongiibacteraceae bacterium]